MATRITRMQFYAVHATRIAQKTVRVVSLGYVRPIWTLQLAGHFAERNRQADKDLGKPPKNQKSSTDPDPYPVKGSMDTMILSRLDKRKPRRSFSHFHCASVAQ